MQARLSSVPSSCSRMLEEGLLFLEEEISKEKIVSAAGGEDFKQVGSKIPRGIYTKETDLFETSLEMGESLKELAITFDEDQKNTDCCNILIISEPIRKLCNDL